MSIDQDQADQMSAHILLNPDALDVLMDQLIVELEKGDVLGGKITWRSRFVGMIAHRAKQYSEQSKYANMANQNAVSQGYGLQNAAAQQYQQQLQMIEALNAQKLAVMQQLEAQRIYDSRKAQAEQPGQSLLNSIAKKVLGGY